MIRYSSKQTNVCMVPDSICFLGGSILVPRTKGVIGNDWELFSWIIISLILPNAIAYIWSFLWWYILVEWKLLCTICILPLASWILIPMEHILYGKEKTIIHTFYCGDCTFKHTPLQRMCLCCLSMDDGYVTPFRILQFLLLVKIEVKN